jgi:uncharacterized protein
MVRRMILAGFAAAILFISWTSLEAKAEKLLAVDSAAIFSSSEKSDLENALTGLSNQYSMDIVIVTTNDADGKSSRDYADDYFDYNGYGIGADRDGILLLMDFDNREVYISTSGKGIRYLTDARIESILDDIFDAGFADGRYLEGAEAFIASTSSFLAQGIPEGQYNEDEGANSISLFDGLIGAAASGASGLGYFATTRKRYKGHPAPLAFNFRDSSLVELGIASDNLINEYTTSRIIPVAPVRSSGGGSMGRSTTHRSGSGRSHGGGGRKF